MNNKSKLRDYLKGFIFFAVVAIVGYATKHYGIGNFSVIFIGIILLYHFVFSRAIYSWQTIFVAQS